MNTKPIHLIKKKIENEEISESDIEKLRMDSRKGVQQLIKIYDKNKLQKEYAQLEFQRKKKFDNQYRMNVHDLIAGVDEAGRGPLAGPVVAAAVILPHDFMHLGVNDSKELSETEREALYKLIVKEAISYSICSVTAEEIDKMNIFEATKLAMQRAVNGLHIKPECALIDAVRLDSSSIPTKEVIKGDAKSLHIAAASILAKVTRDRFMVELDTSYPVYQFKQNKGYGTKRHLEALAKYGPTRYHRRSFSPVFKAMEQMTKEG